MTVGLIGVSPTALASDELVCIMNAVSNRIVMYKMNMKESGSHPVKMAAVMPSSSSCRCEEMG